MYIFFFKFIFDLILIKAYTKAIWILIITYNLSSQKDYYIFKKDFTFFVKLLIIPFILFLYFIFNNY